MSIVFKYGDYEFDPKPLFNITMNPLKTPDGSGYGKNYTISLEGSIITTGTAEIDAGITGLFYKVNNLNDALSNDGKLLLVSCGDFPILSGYPTIESFNIEKDGDNYTRRANYGIEFNMPTLIKGSGNDKFNSGTLTFPPFIESANETWDIEFADERLPFEWTYSGSQKEKFGYKLAVTHNVDVTARLAYTGNMVHNKPWESAKSYASGLLGFDNDFVTLTGVLGLPGQTYFTKYDVFDNYRQVSIDKTAGNIKITETFIVSPSGENSLPNNAIETFEISTSQSEGITSVDINGEIQGLAKISYTGDGTNLGYVVTSSKFSAASGYFNKVKTRMFSRASRAYEASIVADKCAKNRKLNSIVKQRTVGFNPLQGTITYSYQYDTTPSGCITGDCILSQNITIDDTLPKDVYASQTILGRAAGPILQDIGTITNAIKNISIELVTLPPTGCGTLEEIYKPVPTGQVHDFISMISGDLMSNYSQVFVESSSQSWNFTAGRYTRSISFAYTNCDNPA